MILVNSTLKRLLSLLARSAAPTDIRSATPTKMGEPTPRALSTNDDGNSRLVIHLPTSMIPKAATINSGMYRKRAYRMSPNAYKPATASPARHTSTENTYAPMTKRVGSRVLSNKDRIRPMMKPSATMRVSMPLAPLSEGGHIELPAIGAKLKKVFAINDTVAENRNASKPAAVLGWSLSGKKRCWISVLGFRNSG